MTHFEGFKALAWSRSEWSLSPRWRPNPDWKKEATQIVSVQTSNAIVYQRYYCYHHHQENFFSNQDLLQLLMNKSDQYLISPYNIPSPSHIMVRRIKVTIPNWRRSWLLKKFSLSVPQEINREEYILRDASIWEDVWQIFDLFFRQDERVFATYFGHSGYHDNGFVSA